MLLNTRLNLLANKLYDYSRGQGKTWPLLKKEISMKKNILLIPSLVLCSFIASPLLGCEIRAHEYHPITTPTAGDVDLTGIAQLNLPEPQTSTTEEQPNIMLQSVMFPTEEKGLGLFHLGIMEKLASYRRTNVDNVISFLTKKTFDITNKTFLDLLNIAIQDATTNDDHTSLVTILALCRSTEEYKNKIRVSDDAVAKTAFEFLTSEANSAKYDLGIQLANKNIEDGDQQLRLEYNKTRENFVGTLAQLITAYKQDTGIIADKFDALQKREVEQAQSSILNLGELNASIRNNARLFVGAHPTRLIENEIAQERNTANTRLDLLLQRGKMLPTMTIKELEAQPTDK